MRLAHLSFVSLIAVVVTAAAADDDHDVGHTLQFRSLEQHLTVLVEADAAFDSFRARDDLAPPPRAQFDGIQFLLSEDLRTQFLGLSNDSLRAEWWRRYWKLRDPTPTTAINERLEEHERRLAHVREEFRSTKPPYYDDCGVFYLKFGAPAETREELGTTRQGVGYVSTRQWWSYPALGWQVVFSQPVPRGPWILGDHRTQQSNRPDLVRQGSESFVSGHRAQKSDEELPGRDELAMNPRGRGSMPVIDAAAIAGDELYAAAVDHFALPDETGEHLACVFDVDAFRSTAGRTRVEVHLQTALRDLRFAWADSLYVARYRVEGVLLDEAVYEAAYDSYDDLVRASNFRTTTSGVLWPGQLQFDVPPGTYRLAVWIRDTGSGDSVRIAADLNVPQLAGPGLAVSDLELASWIGPEAGTWNPRFSKRDRIVVPNPIGRYTLPNIFLGYFEIYGLQLDSRGRSRYEVKYAIRPRNTRAAEGFFPNSKRVESAFVTAQFTGEGKTADLHETLRVDIGTLEPGAHDLVVTVRDLVAATEATTQTRFALDR